MTCSGRLSHKLEEDELDDLDDEDKLDWLDTLDRELTLEIEDSLESEDEDKLDWLETLDTLERELPKDELDEELLSPSCDNVLKTTIRGNSIS